MENIRHIFFDLDNTLWDHRKKAYLTLQELFQKENISQQYRLKFEDFHREYFTINEDLWAKIRDRNYLRKHRFYDGFLFFGIDDMELSMRFEENFLDQILNYNELVLGALDVLEYLYGKGCILHILSNGFKEVTYRKTELSGIKKYFNTITSADEINIRKPRAEIFQYSLDKASATVNESLMIGDDFIADVEGAIHFGMKAIFFDTLNEDLKKEGVITIKKLSEFFFYSFKA